MVKLFAPVVIENRSSRGQTRMVLMISHNTLWQSYLRLFMLKTGQKKRQKGVFSTELQAHEPRMIILKVPVENDSAAHVLAVAEDDPGRAPVFRLRMGRPDTGGNKPSVPFDFAGQMPGRSEADRVDSENIERPASAGADRLALKGGSSCHRSA